jgi:hypothetical protein
MRLSAAVLAIALVSPAGIKGAGGAESITLDDLRSWLSYIASDELEGRAVFTGGLGLAAGYIQSHLQSWGLKPGGDNGTFLQTVRVQGVAATSRSSVTVTIAGETRTFKDGEGITFPRNAGGKQTLTLNRIEFAGYGLDVPTEGLNDYRGRAADGAALIYLGLEGPKSIDGSLRRVVAGRSRYATDQRRAAAVIGPAAGSGQGTSGRGATPAPGGRQAPDFTTAARFDVPSPPSITATDEFFEFLFSRAPVKYDELRRKARDREPLAGFTVPGVTITFNVDHDYRVIRTQLTQNVVGIVEGTDARLKSTYIALGAHYDHVGHAESELTDDGRRPTPPGRVTAGRNQDRIWNGADDDGSGTVALMALARAFQQGQRPKRSLVFVWHAGEERGLYGSRYFVDHAPMPLDQVIAHLNMDMIGRNRDDRTTEANTVYLVGSDRISSELHELSREANAALARPMTLDYEFNDTTDPEQFYYRSDHYSYAAKGIPSVFFTTGVHPDYHANTDEVSKIEFAKLQRVTGLIYETAARLANRDRAPVRDNLGPRAGKGTR